MNKTTRTHLNNFRSEQHWNTVLEEMKTLLEDRTANV